MKCTTLIILATVLMTGCTALQPKPKPQTVEDPTASKTVESSRVSLDTPTIIQELTDAGCDLLTLEVEKSNRRERLIAGCREVGIGE